MKLAQGLIIATAASAATAFIPLHIDRGWVPSRAQAGEASKEEAHLWASTPNTLLHIGSKGVQASHVRSLGDLLSQHGLVKVKLSDYRLDAAELAFKLKEAEGARLVGIHESGRYLLFSSEV